MQQTSRFERKNQIQFAVAMAAINGSQPTVCTKKLLNQYEHGDITSSQLKRAIVKNIQKRIMNEE